jgi:hypothetical protein
VHAGVSTGMVFAANVLVRILARLVNRRTTSPTEMETSYQMRVICREADATLQTEEVHRGHRLRLRRPKVLI